MKNKLFTLLLAVAASVGTMFAWDYENVQIGDLYYNLDATNHTAEVAKNISASGDIIIPSSVTYNEISYSVTSIGDGTFYQCSSLTSVTIPNSVTSIGEWAFFGCTGLTSVTIPNSVTSIGEMAFAYCRGLASIEIPNSVTSIGGEAFYGCGSLTSVNVASDNSNYCSVDGVLFNKDKTTLIQYPGGKQGAYTIPNSVTSIGYAAFYGCSSLTSMTIPNSVTSIGYMAFAGCSGLTSVTIPNSVTSIGSSAFSNCTGLTSPVYNAHVFAFMPTSYSGAYTIPDGIESIAGGAFMYCSGLTSVTIPNSVTNIGDGTFYQCSSLTSVTIPNSVTSIGDHAFYECSGLTSITCEAITPPTLGSNVFSSVDKSIPLYVPTGSVEAYQTADQWKDFTNILPIGETPAPTTYTVTFKDWDGTVLKTEQVEDGHSATAPANPTREGYTFSGWDKEYINVQSELIVTAQYTQNSITPDPDSEVASPPSDEIWYTSSDGNIVTPGSTTYALPTIVSNTYSNGKGIIKFASDVTSIGGIAFRGCSGLTSVTIPNSVTSIGDRAFADCSGLTSMTIPNSVTRISWYAFSGCIGLTSPVYNAHVFAYMPRFYTGTYVIPDGIESIAGGAFDDCTDLTSLTIPCSVTSIGENAFSGCRGLASVMWNAKIIRNSPTGSMWGISNQIISFIFGNEVEMIPSGICAGLKQLTSIIIPNSVTSIGSAAFSGCSGLTGELVIPNSVTSIGEWAFADCSGLTSVTIPKNLTSIGITAFWGCTSLASIIWNAKNCPDFAYNYTPFCANYHEGWSQLDLRSQITSFIFGKEVVHIPAHLCEGIANLTTEVIPTSVTSIGDSAFSGCAGLQEIVCESTTPPSIGINMFDETNNCPIYVPCGTLATYKSAWSTYASRITYSPTPACIFTISTNSANPEWGTTAGDTVALYLDEVEISSIPNYGYHFAQWSDGNTDNPRTIELTQDTTFTAEFAKNTYTISTTSANLELGTTSGDTTALYLDEVAISAIPNYGYHFAQWSDGNTDNPRTIELTQDTTFTAEFAIDKSGTCGDDNALTWTYDTETKTLTITGNGTLNSNYTFGIEAPTQMQKLVIGNEVTSIGDSAFYGMSTINHLIIGGSVATIGNYAFAECRNFDDITCLANVVPVINETTFANVGNKQYIYLFVPETRERAYHRDTYWGEFDIQVQQAEGATVTTNDVTVEPQDNAATVTWPTNDNAATYTLQITKDGVVFCTLIFNANGQLTGIAFAPGRDGEAHAPAALMTANGLQFTVTGLDSDTQYGYNLTAKDANDQTVATYSGSFTTTSEGIATGVEEVSSSLQGGDRGRLILRDGQIYILRGEKVYTVDGRQVR